jgi:hypothetical protein
LKWLEKLTHVRTQLHRIAKHHKTLWEKSRRDFEVAKATQEGRAGKLQRAMHMGLVAEVPPKFARAGGSRPDFGPKKSKKTHKNTHKIKIK